MDPFQPLPQHAIWNHLIVDLVAIEVAIMCNIYAHIRPSTTPSARHGVTCPEDVFMHTAPLVWVSLVQCWYRGCAKSRMTLNKHYWQWPQPFPALQFAQHDDMLDLGEHHLGKVP